LSESAFQEDASGKLVAGVFRVSSHSSSQISYAHAEHATEAAIVAMSDAILVEARDIRCCLRRSKRAAAGFATALLYHWLGHDHSQSSSIFGCLTGYCSSEIFFLLPRQPDDNASYWERSELNLCRAAQPRKTFFSHLGLAEHP
jgi:hypothetical protein